MNETTKSRLAAVQEQERLFGNGPDSTLPSICMDLRLGVNGSTDEWKPKQVAEAVQMLEARLET